MSAGVDSDTASVGAEGVGDVTKTGAGTGAGAAWAGAAGRGGGAAGAGAVAALCAGSASAGSAVVVAALLPISRLKKLPDWALNCPVDASAAVTDGAPELASGGAGSAAPATRVSARPCIEAKMICSWLISSYCFAATATAISSGTS